MSLVNEKILIIDDEEDLRQALSRILELEGYEVMQAGLGNEGLKICGNNADISLVISDVRLPDLNGMTILENLKSDHHFCEVILITAFGSIHDGVEAMKRGAFDYITKGDGDEEIVVVVEKAITKAKMQRRIRELENRLELRYHFDQILGNSLLLNEAKELARKVAKTDSGVLIEGETGTGKELFAQSIHNESLRRSKPFIAVNCSAFPHDLMESVIFGHKKGAFTSASYDKKGLFEEAHEGTLFLDEVSEMHPDLQSKLLRVVENQCFTRVGDTVTIKADVRIIAATNKELQSMMQEGLFRADLYYRLAVFKIHLPALRERPEDISVIANHFVELYAQKINKRLDGYDESFLEKLISYPWPGNIRELKNLMERCIILADGPTLSQALLPPEFHGHLPGGIQNSVMITMREMESRHIRQILHYTDGNKSRASKILGISIATLYRKIEQYQIQL